ncbi:unnamed protein product [Hyaloperonospora brassicae]|uniref:FYVE-type domain-containing protein n=1 Tax=Hyaloperonospora brassicae TaxID=162125 RepID=A0AAV0T803_HYABA|nr:unnamed protein product [Hyaloperonospora brassicae]
MGKARTLSRQRAQSAAPGNGATPVPLLSAHERAYMIRKAKEASVALVEHAHTLDGPVQWHYTGKFRGIQMYRGEGSYDHGGSSGTEFLCGVTTMMGAIEEVADYFDQQTTEQMRAKKAEDVLDCGVLYLLVRGDPKNPFYRVSAKYQLLEGPSAFSRERDYCFLECQNTFRHASGRRGWVLSMHSIKLPSCPEIDGIVRGSMYQSGYVFVEAEKKGYMDVMHSLQINFKSTNRLPHFLLNSALKRRILSVVTISREIQTTRMGRQTLLKKKQLMPKRSRVLCVNCARKFSLFVRKTRCRVCGEVVCQPCAPQVTISTKYGVVKTRVCTRCCHLSPRDDYEEEEESLPYPRDGDEDLRRMQNETRYSDILQDHQDHPDKYRDDDYSIEDDEDEDGLEEQSDYSVFAQSRFTDASRDSAGTSQFGASKFDSHFKGSSHFGTTNELDDSQYNGGVNTSVDSSVSGTSTSDWTGGNSAASSMMEWNQASSTRPADGYIYDPQASTTSNNFYGASSGGSSDYEGRYRAYEGKPDRRIGRYDAAAPIPEDEPHSHRGGYVASYNSSTKSKSMRQSTHKAEQGTKSRSMRQSTHKAEQGTTSRSMRQSKNKAEQGTNYDESYDSHALNTNHTGKTLSIQSLAKTRAARYGIKSEFPPPPPPPPLSPLLREREVGDSPLHLGALKSDKIQSLQDRKPKGIAARKCITSLSPKEGRRGTDRLSSKRAPKIPPSVASTAGVAGRSSHASRASSRGSRSHDSDRPSAILEQVRRNRNRALRHDSGSNRSSAALKSMEEEHLARMCEIERMQELVSEKEARRLTVPNWSRSSASFAQSDDRCQSDRSSAAAIGRKQPLRGSRRYSSHTTSDSPMKVPYASPPGTPPSVRSRRVPKNAFVDSKDIGSFGGNRSRRMGDSSHFEKSRFLSDRSNNAFVKSDDVRVSLAPSARSEDLVFNTHRSGFRVSKGSNSSSNDRRVNNLQKSRNTSYRGRQSDTSSVSSVSDFRHPDGISLDMSQISVNGANASSKIAMMEPFDKSSDNIAMMERFSAERNSLDSLLDEDLLNQSLAGMTEHIDSMRARAAYKLPDEERSLSDDLQRLQEEHRKRMEELTKMTDNHVIADDGRDSSSTFGGLHDSSSSLSGLHDSSSSLTGYPGNRFGDSTMSSTSSAGSVDIDDGEFDFGSRALGRTKRSGTIAFALGELRSVEGDDGESESTNGSEMSYCLSEDYAEREYRSEEKMGYDSSEDLDIVSHKIIRPSAGRYSEESDRNDNEDESEPMDVSYCSSEESDECKTRVKRGFTTPPRRSSVESVEREYEQVSGLATPPRGLTANAAESVSERLGDPAFYPSGEMHEENSSVATPPHRPRLESIDSTHSQNADLRTPPRRLSVESVESMSQSVHDVAALPRRPSVESEDGGHGPKSGFARLPQYQSAESMKDRHERTGGSATSPHFSSAGSAESEHEEDTSIATTPCRPSVESVESDSEHEQSAGVATPMRRSSVESVESESEPEQSAGIIIPTRRSCVESVESEHEQSAGIVTPPRRSSVESVETQSESEQEPNASVATPPRRSSVESVESESEPEQSAGIIIPTRRSCVESVEGEHEQSAGIVTPPRRSSVESVETQSESESEQEQNASVATPPRRSSVESVESEQERSAGIATPPRRSSVESIESESEHEQSAGIATPPRRSSVESMESEVEQEQNASVATRPRRSSVESVESESKQEQDASIATPTRRLSVESVDSESKQEQNASVATPTRRLSVESVESEVEQEQNASVATRPRRSSVESVDSESKHEQSAGIATPTRRLSVESMESEVEQEQNASVATPTRRSSLESVESEVEHEQSAGIATPTRRSSLESVESEGEHEQSASIATPPRRSSAEYVETEQEQKASVATPPHRSNVESFEIEVEHEQSAGFATPTRRSSVESVESESEHEQSAGIATPPRRSSVESVETQSESEHEQSAGITIMTRRSSVESAESEHEQSAGIATPPRRSSVESVETQSESEHEQNASVATSQRRSSVESDESESEHEQSAGIATPPRRSSVESVESESGHEQSASVATSPRRSNVESGEIEAERMSGMATPLRHQRVGPVESEVEYTNGITTPPCRQSVELAESGRGHKNGPDNARSSHSSSEEHDKDLDEIVVRKSDKKDGQPTCQSGEEAVEQQGDFGHTESAYRSSNESEIEHASAMAKRLSKESVTLETRYPKFDPESSQLVLGEGGSAVDEFYADMPTIVSDSKLIRGDENGEADTHSHRGMSQVYLNHAQLHSNANEDGNHEKASLFEMSISSRASSPDISEHALSSFRESCASAIDEELMNRPTMELFDVIRANRSTHDMDGSRSPDTMSNLEASHLRRMEELNRIAVDHLGNRISDLDEDLLGSAFRPGRSLHPGFRDEETVMQWRSSDVMEEVHSKHEMDMEKLRRRIRRLEEECRESIALTAEEIGLSDSDDDDDDGAFNGLRSFHGHQSFGLGRSLGHQASFASGQSSIISEDNDDMDAPPSTDEPLPARVLLEQIAQLTRLQQEMADAENSEDEEETHARIKEQYRVLRAIKANSRQDSGGSESEDDDNWI